MGIRFYCPNGHKLNVKEFLAGQRGICPKCGAQMEIPFKSTREPGSKDLPQAAVWEAQARANGTLPSPAAAQGGRKNINLNAIQPEANPAATVGGGAVNQPQTSPWPQDDPAANYQPASPQRTSSGGTTFRNPAPPAAPAPQKRFPDPFEGPKDTVWYVRSSDGQQYGPADGASIKQWLAEGRIAADTLVWREGWPEWKRGDEVFESLASPFNFN